MPGRAVSLSCSSSLLLFFYNRQWFVEKTDIEHDEVDRLGSFVDPTVQVFTVSTLVSPTETSKRSPFRVMTVRLPLLESSLGSPGWLIQSNRVGASTTFSGSIKSGPRVMGRFTAFDTR